MFQSKLPGHQVSFKIYHSGLVSLGLEQSGNVNTKLFSKSLLVNFSWNKSCSFNENTNFYSYNIVKIIIVVAQFYMKVVVQDTSGLW